MIQEYERCKGDPLKIQESEYRNLLTTMTRYENLCEKNRDRIEYRYCWATQDTSVISRCMDEWECVKTVALMKSIRIPVEKDEDGNDITADLDTFLKCGSVRKPKINEEDGIDDDIQLVGLIANKKLTAKEMALYKRLYWAIESGCHYVSDQKMIDEDRCTARGRNRLKFATLRKSGYNLQRIAQQREYPDKSMKQMAYLFCDQPEILGKYCFESIKSFA